jgi:hypothetical protein
VFFASGGEASPRARQSKSAQKSLDEDQPSVGVTPGGAVALFEAQVQEVQSQLDELGDLARQHGISPGILRS